MSIPAHWKHKNLYQYLRYCLKRGCSVTTFLQECAITARSGSSHEWLITLFVFCIYNTSRPIDAYMPHLTLTPRASSQYVICKPDELVHLTEHTHGLCFGAFCYHYNDVIMGSMASQITSLTIVFSAVYSGADQRKHQSFASLTFVWRIHRGPLNSPPKWSVTEKMFPFDDVIMMFLFFTHTPLSCCTGLRGNRHTGK